MSLVHSLAVPSSYKDQQYQGNQNQLSDEPSSTTTLYVGNLSFYTTEEQLYELFSKAGEIKRIIMGLDRNQKTPCGFLFCRILSLSFKEGRQYGRGRNGGQVRDEYREEYDAGRGGWGHRTRVEMERQRAREQQQNYEAIQEVPAGAGEYKSNASAAANRKRTMSDEQPEDRKRQKEQQNPRFRENDDEEDDE
ncbi:unnamed protein product [Absidia cylindrospora]